jgi:hypothetical protein
MHAGQPNVPDVSTHDELLEELEAAQRDNRLCLLHSGERVRLAANATSLWRTRRQLREQHH